MSLTTSEKTRLEELEKRVKALATLVSGGGSKNQLNRLLILAGDENRKLSNRVAELETKVTELLELAEKLQ